MKVLVSEEQFQQGIRRWPIRSANSAASLTLIGVQIGSIMLLSDLVKLLDALRVKLVRRETIARTFPAPARW